MMKKMLCILFAVFVIAGLSTTVLAAKCAVVDDAGLLSVTERSVLEEELQEVSQKHDMDIVVLTVDSLGGKSAMAYADDYYDHNGYGDDGVLLLVCMQSRQWWISTSGKCISKLDADAFEADLVADLQAEDYYGAFFGFAQNCHRQMSVSAGAVLVCVLLGTGIALIVVMVMKSKMKTVRSQSGADSYVSDGRLELTNQSDIFLYQTVTRRPKPQNNGGSGSHIGSSGRSHGGGGGRF